MPQKLGDRWISLCRRIGCNSAADILRRLEVAYTEKSRAYHTLDHIDQCLRELDSARDTCEDADAVEAAIWFHDAVYDSTRTDNEERSAELARTELTSGGVKPQFAQKVHDLILVTKHDKPPETIDGQILADIDLASLAISPDKFDANTQAIRREFRQVDDQAFRDGRVKFLRQLLARPHIYYTPIFRDRYEAEARQNLERSLRRLSEPNAAASAGG